MSPQMPPTLLFLHGFLGSPKDWDPLIQHLPSHLISHALTLPGHQHTPFSESLNFIRETITTEKVTLVGYSLGGRLSLAFAKRFPHLIDKLILLSTNPGIEDLKERKKRYETDLIWANLLKNEGLSIFLKKWYASPIFSHLKITKTLLEQRKNHNPFDLIKVLTQLSLGIMPSLWNKINQLPFETLFLFGEFDKKYSEIAKHLQTQIGSIKKSSHAIHIESPKLCAQKITHFISL